MYTIHSAETLPLSAHSPSQCDTASHLRLNTSPIPPTSTNLPGGSQRVIHCPPTSTIPLRSHGPLSPNGAQRQTTNKSFLVQDVFLCLSSLGRSQPVSHCWPLTEHWKLCLADVTRLLLSSPAKFLPPRIAPSGVISASPQYYEVSILLLSDITVASAAA